MSSPAPKMNQEIEIIPLQIVGSNHFGRYPKISREETWNFIISDNALVPYAGYSRAVALSPAVPGRGIYSSSRGNIMIAVLGSNAYSINAGLVATFIGPLESSTGDVFFAENNNGEISFTDGFVIYVYNWLTNTYNSSGTVGGVTVPAALVNPGYISFQNGRMIVANTNSTNWYLSAANNALLYTGASNSVGALQSKPDKVQAAVPTPGGGNNLYLFGHNVVEQWQDVGAALFPYQRSSTFNVDYGTVNASSIAAMDDYVVWLSANETSGVALMVIRGNQPQRISTDGIDYVLSNLSNPKNCSGFLFRQDGHVIYQFTFPDDNLSYAYDFNTQSFFTVTDEDLNYHIANDVVFFNNQYYMVSFKGGNVYAFSTQFTDADYGDGDIQQLPRIRITPPARRSNQRMSIFKSLGFTIENGQPNPGGTTEAVDLSVSRDGGETFSNQWRNYMNPTGRRKSRFIWQRLGQANDFTAQLRFSGFGRFVVFDGELEVYS